MLKPRVHWDINAGWTIDTPVPLSKAQLVGVVAWTKKVQSQRLLDKSGDVREQMERALAALSPATLKVNLLPESGLSVGERVLYKD